jgi:hypothetical protein
VLLSTLLHAILHPSHHLLNVFLQIANKLGLSKKKPTTLLHYYYYTYCYCCRYCYCRLKFVGGSSNYSDIVLVFGYLYPYFGLPSCLFQEIFALKFGKIFIFYICEILNNSCQFFYLFQNTGKSTHSTTYCTIIVKLIEFITPFDKNYKTVDSYAIKKIRSNAILIKICCPNKSKLSSVA